MDSPIFALKYSCGNENTKRSQCAGPQQTKTMPSESTYIHVCGPMCHRSHVSLFLAKPRVRYAFIFFVCRARVRVWVCECVLDVCVCVWECAKPFVCFFPLFYFSGGKFLCESKGGASFFSRKRRSPFDTLPPPNRKIFFGFFPTWTPFTCIDRYTHVCATVFNTKKSALGGCCCCYSVFFLAVLVCIPKIWICVRIENRVATAMHIPRPR